MSPSDPGITTTLRRVIPLLAAALVLLVAAAPSAAQVDPTTTLPPTTVTTLPPTTAPPPPTTAPPPPTTAPPPPTTVTPPTTVAPTTTTTQPATTTTSSSTTTSTVVTTTVVTDDDGGSNVGWWIAAGLLGLAVILGIAWLVMRKTRQHDTAASWDSERLELLDEARRAHDSTIDLLARWSSLDREQLHRRWSHEMSQLERLRTHLSGLMAHAPAPAAGDSAIGVQHVATAVDDLRMALGDADVTPTSDWSVVPPPAPTHAAAACDALDLAITQAQQGDQRRH